MSNVQTPMFVAQKGKTPGWRDKKPSEGGSANPVTRAHFIIGCRNQDGIQDNQIIWANDLAYIVDHRGSGTQADKDGVELELWKVDPGSARAKYAAYHEVWDITDSADAIFEALKDTSIQDRVKIIAAADLPNFEYAKHEKKPGQKFRVDYGVQWQQGTTRWRDRYHELVNSVSVFSSVNVKFNHDNPRRELGITSIRYIIDVRDKHGNPASDGATMEIGIDPSLNDRLDSARVMRINDDPVVIKAAIEEAAKDWISRVPQDDVDVQYAGAEDKFRLDTDNLRIYKPGRILTAVFQNAPGSSSHQSGLSLRGAAKLALQTPVLGRVLGAGEPESLELSDSHLEF
ncbi:MAG: hypothetical protein AAF182_03455 [Pseudomonadota bacterium]